MIPPTETTDHDAGAPPLHMPPLGVLVPVLIDGRCWALLLPGDQVAEILLGTELEVTIITRVELMAMCVALWPRPPHIRLATFFE